MTLYTRPRVAFLHGVNLLGMAAFNQWLSPVNIWLWAVGYFLISGFEYWLARKGFRS